MNKRLLLAFVLLVSINLGSMAQLLPIKNVPSPEIAGLGELKCTPEVRQINAYDIFEPIKNKLDDVFWKNW
ncbi:hypothetical protein [Bacteroides acidifaciens]|uniref:hypothetical protein n=1 Tax=Bacteroides acidifaciens TaxID=85831 RepID=UPI00158AD605|nr:hypothetical protein [Bacteroides acidifaciens]